MFLFFRVQGKPLRADRFVTPEPPRRSGSLSLPLRGVLHRRGIAIFGSVALLPEPSSTGVA